MLNIELSESGWTSEDGNQVENMGIFWAKIPVKMWCMCPKMGSVYGVRYTIKMTTFFWTDRPSNLEVVCSRTPHAQISGIRSLSTFRWAEMGGFLVEHWRDLSTCTAFENIQSWTCFLAGWARAWRACQIPIWRLAWVLHPSSPHELTSSFLTVLFKCRKAM